jgi:hypothetical protein
MFIQTCMYFLTYNDVLPTTSKPSPNSTNSVSTTTNAAAQTKSSSDEEVKVSSCSSSLGCLHQNHAESLKEKLSKLEQANLKRKVNSLEQELSDKNECVNKLEEELRILQEKYTRFRNTFSPTQADKFLYLGKTILRYLPHNQICAC